MIKAAWGDKELIIDILTKSFDGNQSVNYMVKAGRNRVRHIRYLMEYSFIICHLFGEVYLSNDRNGCALILYPEQKRSTFKAIMLDVKLVLFSIGLRNVFKALSRESAIKKTYPKGKLMYYLWFIGVHPAHQHKGTGTELLNSLLTDCVIKKRDLFLETSMEANLSWYKKFGFSIYHTLDFGYTLYFLKLNKSH